MSIITRVYEAFSHAERAIGELEAARIPSSAISLIANRNASDKFADVEEAAGAGAGAGLGAAFGGSAGLLAGFGLLAIPGLGPAVAAGWLASMAVCAAAGAATGGLIGALVGTGMSEDDANLYAEVVRRGGTIVTVRVDEGSIEQKVREIMDRYGPLNMTEWRSQYASEGNSPVDPSSQPYLPRGV